MIKKYKWRYNSAWNIVLDTVPEMFYFPMHCPL